MAKGGRAAARVRRDGERAVYEAAVYAGAVSAGALSGESGAGEMLSGVLSGEMVLQSCARGKGVTRRQLRRVRKDGWTDVRRALFLQVLAATCNVREACRAAGLHFSGAYDLRRRDPAFADAWADAIEQSYSELEMRLLRDCLNGAARVEVIREGHGPMARVKSTKTVTAVPHAIALRLLQAHRATAEARRAQVQAARHARPDDPDVVARMKAEMDAMVERNRAARALMAAEAAGAESGRAR